MIGGSTEKIINTTFKWTGLDGGGTQMGKLAAGAALAATAVVAASKAVWDLAVKTTALYAPFEDMSARVGIAASDLHALSLAAEQSGSSFDAITTGLRRMPSFLQDAQNGMESATRSLDALGISVEDLAGLSMEDQFYRLVDALGAVQDESTRAALAQDVFGRGGQQLMPVIEEGTGALRQFAAEARETGMVLDDEAYAAADRFQDAIQLMQARLQGALMEGIEPLLPELQATAESLVAIAADAIPQLMEALTAAMPILTSFSGLLSKSLEGWTMLIQGYESHFGLFLSWDFEDIINAQAARMTTAPQMLHGEERAAFYGRSRLAIEEELAAKQAEYTTSLTQELDILGGGGGGGGGGDSILDAERARNELLDYRMQILEKQQSLEEEQAAAAEAAAQAVADRIAEKEQAEYDARLERLQTYADLTTQVMGAAWDSLFTDTRQSFGDMLKDMMADMLKSGFLNLIRKGILGGASGGLGFFF